MTDTDTIVVNGLAVMISAAAASLAKATTAAEVLDVIQHTTIAYDAAKSAARFAKAKRAHAEIIAACHKAQGDALEIEAQAKRRLADEYDAAQERGEVAGQGGARNFKVSSENFETTLADIGLTKKEIYEARKVRDAMQADPEIIKRTLAEMLHRGEEPTRAALRRAIMPKTTAPPVTSPMVAQLAPEPEPEVNDEDEDEDEDTYPKLPPTAAVGHESRIWSLASGRRK